MNINPIFEDINDEETYYFIAKDIAEHIQIAIDEIKSLDGFHEITGSFVTFKGKNCHIAVEFVNNQGTKYSWDFTNTYKLRYTNSVPKVLYCWINKWRDSIENDWGKATCFNFE